MSVNFSFRWRQQIVEDQTIASTTKLVAHTLHYHMDNNTGECFPSEELIAKESGLSIRCVVMHIKKLKQNFYITIKKEKGGQGWNRNMYKALLRPAYAALSYDEESASDAKGHANEGQKVVQEVHSNSSINSSYNSIREGINDKNEFVYYHQFWELYPQDKRYGERKCKALWIKNNLEEIGQEIIDGLKTALSSKQWRDGFIPGPLKYLDEEQWQKKYINRNVPNYV